MRVGLVTVIAAAAAAGCATAQAETPPVTLAATPDGYTLTMGEAVVAGPIGGAPIEVTFGDVDGDGAEDALVRLERASAGSNVAVDVYDLTGPAPALAFVSDEGCLEPPDTLAACRAEFAARVSPAAALEAARWLDANVSSRQTLDWEFANIGVPNALNTVLAQAHQAAVIAARQAGDVEAEREAVAERAAFWSGRGAQRAD